jgi:hypothetical protein
MLSVLELELLEKIGVVFCIEMYNNFLESNFSIETKIEKESSEIFV